MRRKNKCPRTSSSPRPPQPSRLLGFLVNSCVGHKSTINLIYIILLWLLIKKHNKLNNLYILEENQYIYIYICTSFTTIDGNRRQKFKSINFCKEFLPLCTHPSTPCSNFSDTIRCDRWLPQTTLPHLHHQTVADQPAFRTATHHKPTSLPIYHKVGTEWSKKKSHLFICIFVTWF